MWQITLEKKEILKEKKQLIDKYESLLDKYSKRSYCKISLIKAAILNLTSEEIPNPYESLLNPGPKFAPTNKNLPDMDIITSAEFCALDMEYNREKNGNWSSMKYKFYMMLQIFTHHYPSIKQLM